MERHTLPPEDDRGNIEYKLVVAGDRPRIEGLKTQMAGRLDDGGGQAVYWVGVMDSGCMVGIDRPHLQASIANLQTVAGEIGASVDAVEEWPAVWTGGVQPELRPYIPADRPRFVARLTVRGTRLQDPFYM